VEKLKLDDPGASFVTVLGLVQTFFGCLVEEEIGGTVPNKIVVSGDGFQCDVDM